MSLPPTAPTPPNTAEAAELVALVLQLARPGARLRTTQSGDAVLARHTDPENMAALPIVPEALVRAARSANYLTLQSAKLASSAREGSTSRIEVLSPTGRSVARAALMATPVQAGNRHALGTRATRQTARAVAAIPHRPMERRAIVEQLGQRRDGQGKPLLSDVQIAAALRLAQDFAIAHLQPRVTARWSAEAVPDQRRRGGPGAGAELSAATSAAQARTRSALAALGGLADIALDVCCFEKGLEQIEATRQWPSRSARIVLQYALTQLAEHYGMARTQRPRDARVRHWGDDDFRPSAER